MYIDKRKQTFVGFVMRTLMNPGTRSEADAYILEMDKRNLRLAMKNNREYETEIFESYINEEVEVTGNMGQGVFFVEDIRRVND